MGKITRIYWKRQNGVVAEYISGCCMPDRLPDYGMTGDLDIPGEVVVATDDAGNLTALSPPVIGDRFAYRYKLWLSPQRRSEVAGASDFALDMMLGVLSCEAPEKGTSRSNWWWYAQDRFSTLGYGRKTPVSLMKKWKRAMLEILLENHPEKEEKIAEWDGRIANHKACKARNRTSRTSAHIRTNGDLVVLPRPVQFTREAIKQIFRYSVDTATHRRRNKHSLIIRGTRYLIPHGAAMTFAKGTAPDENLSVPIRTAMCLLAWAEAPQSSAHTILASRQRFEALADDLIARIETLIDEPAEGVGIFLRSHDIAAAISALNDFHPPAPSKEAPAMEVALNCDIGARIQHSLMLLRTAAVRIGNGAD